MPCYHPLIATKTKGTVQIIGAHRHDMPARAWRQEFNVPCGQCIGCRLERSRQWAIRCVHEASLHKDNCYITLTYADQHLPATGSLQLTDFQKFMKRLRKHFEPQKIRFYHCGEYGGRYNRPHYHALLFGVDFKDKYHWVTNNGNPLSRSPTLEALWTNKDKQQLGNCTIGRVTFESAAYVARYITEKITGPDAQKHYGERTPEYSTMSRRPGIGSNWLSTYKNEVYPQDRIYMRGTTMKPPRAYDRIHELHNPEHMEHVRQQRIKKRVKANEHPDRLTAAEEIKKAQLTQLPRKL